MIQEDNEMDDTPYDTYHHTTPPGVGHFPSVYRVWVSGRDGDTQTSVVKLDNL